MNPSKVSRERLESLSDLPNIGKAMAQDLVLLGIKQPADLKGQNPYELYDRLCEKTGVVHDPCVLDVFISVTRFMDGGSPQPWWKFTQERKNYLMSLR